MNKAHGDEIGMGVAEIGGSIGGEQVPAALVAGEGGILLFAVDKENIGVLRVFMLAVRAGEAGKRPGMAAVGTLQPALGIIAEDGQVGESAANRAVARCYRKKPWTRSSASSGLKPERRTYA